jgi:hypothetical protein
MVSRRSSQVSNGEARPIDLRIGDGGGTGGEIAETGDYLARTALKALLYIRTSPDSRVERGTEVELSDALMAWVETRREAPGGPGAV